MSPRPKLSDQHPDLESAIKDSAWQQISEKGAASLSLRGIARALGITAPAIYNYFSNRDALVTALIVDAFQSFGDAQVKAIADISEDDHALRLRTLGLAYRQWAVDHPQRYQLIFGTPIPGYHAPADVTTPAAAWSLVPLTETLQAIHTAGKLQVDQRAPLTPALSVMLEAWSEFTGGVNVEALYAAVVVWSRVHGLVSMEIGNQLPSFITDPGEIYRREMKIIQSQFIGE